MPTYVEISTYYVERKKKPLTPASHNSAMQERKKKKKSHGKYLECLTLIVLGQENDINTEK